MLAPGNLHLNRRTQHRYIKIGRKRETNRGNKGNLEHHPHRIAFLERVAAQLISERPKSAFFAFDFDEWAANGCADFLTTLKLISFLLSFQELFSCPNGE